MIGELPFTIIGEMPLTMIGVMPFTIIGGVSLICLIAVSCPLRLTSVNRFEVRVPRARTADVSASEFTPTSAVNPHGNRSRQLEGVALQRADDNITGRGDLDVVHGYLPIWARQRSPEDHLQESKQRFD